MDEVELLGKSFKIAEKIGLMPLLRFAKAAQNGVDSNDMAGLAALLDVLEQCIDPDEWQRFNDHADKTRADEDELLQMVYLVIEAISDRPISRPSDSSAGPPATGPRSVDGSSRALRLLEGRPDLQVAVLRAAQQSA